MLYSLDPVIKQYNFMNGLRFGLEEYDMIPKGYLQMLDLKIYFPTFRSTEIHLFL